MYHAAILVLALLLSIMTKPSFAADPEVKELDYGTREQFRACLDSEDRIKAHSKMIAEYIAANNALMLRIQTEAAAIVEEQKTIDTTNRMQVEAFNKRTAEHNKLVISANESAEKTKAEQDAYNQELVKHNKGCAALVFKLSDREAVLKERRAAETKADGKGATESSVKPAQKPSHP